MRRIDRVRSWLVVVALAIGCGPVNQPLDLDDVWPGDLVFEQPAQLVQLSRVSAIAGSLIIRSTAELATLSLPGLVRVEGDVIIEKLPMGPELRVELPNLLQLGGGVELRDLGAPVTFSAPRLGRADYIRLARGAPKLELDLLLLLRGRLQVEDVELEALTLPSLESVGGELLLRRVRTADPSGAAEIPVDLPRLRDIGRNLTLSGTTETRFSAPELLTLGGTLELDGAKVALQLDRLNTIDGGIRILESVFDLDAPALMEVRGRITLSEGVFEGPPRSGRRRGLFLPALERVAGSIRVSDFMGLESFEAPALRSAEGEVVFSGLPDLMRIDLGLVQRIFGDLVVELLFDTTLVALELLQIDGPMRISTMRKLNCELPRLTTVAQDLELSVLEAEVLDLSSLESVGRSLTLRQVAMASDPDLPALRSVGVNLEIDKGSGLRQLDLPLLEQVGGGQSDDFGDLLISENSDLVGLQVPRLVRVSNAIEIRDNPLLDPDALEQSLAGVGSASRLICGNGTSDACPL